MATCWSKPSPFADQSICLSIADLRKSIISRFKSGGKLWRRAPLALRGARGGACWSSICPWLTFWPCWAHHDFCRRRNAPAIARRGDFGARLYWVHHRHCSRNRYRCFFGRGRKCIGLCIFGPFGLRFSTLIGFFDRDGRLRCTRWRFDCRCLSTR